MPLVDYGSSSESETEEIQSTKQPQPGPKSSFQKVVSAKNPRKIVVSLPTADDDATLDSEPAAKKPRTGGSFGGLNSFLPAPKRTGQAQLSNDGLRRAVNLKTGAEPAFDRSERSAPSAVEEKDEEDSSPPNREPTPPPAPEVAAEMRKKVLQFRPLSVARKAKKPIKPSVKSQPDTEPQQPPKISLFSISSEEPSGISQPYTSFASAYQPLIYTTTNGHEDGESPHENQDQLNQTATQNAGPEPSLAAIAADLNLTPSEQRRLLGRQGGKGREVQIKTYDMDSEYAANRAAIASGELAPASNPVRSIAPGRHSLQQLLNAASSQRDALEESFAAGKRNKKEAASKYGW